MRNITWKGSNKWAVELLSIEQDIDKEIQRNEEFHEGNIVISCLKSMAEGKIFFIGNSMPIRDVDIFTSTSEKFIHTYSNRGASGIDGVISTALGISLEKNAHHSLLLIGDLSLYHDMNGLLASKYGMNLSIVVINNSGGGIFSFLPISNSGLKKYDQFWTTNTCLDLEKIAELYKCRYYLSKDLQELENNILDSFKVNGVKIIEIKTVISENITAHQKFMAIAERMIS
jgi:2-succinyl-5-enolpyruvyl-6-hydroxy-3-cyclohexene-1-carboxylate synthase